MDGECLDGIGRAGRGEAARRGTAFEGPLIGHDQGNQPRTEATSCRRSNSSSTNERRAAVGWAPIRYSPAGNDEAANSAWSCRRKRLRTTAGPMARPSAYATLGGMASGSGTYVHHRTPARVRLPSWAKRVNALRSRMRQIKPTGCADPWRGEPSTRHGRHGCSSDGGSRASWRGDDCSVGRCASRNPPRPRTQGGQRFRWQVRIWKGTPQPLGYPGQTTRLRRGTVA